MVFSKYISRLSILPVVLGWRCPVLLDSEYKSTADVCEKVLPSVFRIHGNDGNTTISVGSGFFIRPDGTGLTAAHVVSKNLSYHAKLDSGQEYPMKILNSHPLSDIALIKVQAPTPVPYLTLSDSSKARRGEQIIHYGNTIFGSSTEIDVGYINKLFDDTPKWVEIQMTENIESFKSGIQYIITSGSVRPGFSGGPLVNMKGEVVGLIARLYIRGQGPSMEHEGASIPSNVVKGVIKQLELSGKVQRPYIGLSFVNHNPGLAVVKIQSGSPAEKAGLKIGDVVLTVNGRNVNSNEDILTVIGYNIGIILDMKINRDGSFFNVKVYT